MEKEKYIGKKIEGFKFSEDEACDYIPEMDLVIGVEGEITHYMLDDDSFVVYFGDNVFWAYPARLVLERLERKELIIKIMHDDEESGLYND